jgi:S-adenosylmethionine synthetase
MIRTAEFVSPMHPDKLCDRISDAIVDQHLKYDPLARCAVETCGGHGKVFITGEITSTYIITDVKIKELVKEIANVDDVTVHLVKQSPEIAQGVDIGGAGDQGIMIGYACRENVDFLPQEYYMARELNRFIFNKFPFDGKTQVTINGNDLYVVCSFQNVDSEKLTYFCKRFFHKRFEDYNLVRLFCNPAGDWNIGGFDADAGVTGRKLAVDNYGPRVPIGGGAFSGKDATKVDRSGAYMARRIAVDILQRSPKVQEVQVELSYAIGYNQPIQATAILDGVEVFINDIAEWEYDLSPKAIIEFLDLRQPIYSKTAMWGHMGNDFNWK